MSSFPDPSKQDLLETSGMLIELLRDGRIFATRDSDGALRFHAPEHGGSEDALPVEEVIRELSGSQN